MVICFRCFETILVSFTIQKQASLMVCKDDDGHPFLIVSEIILVSFTMQRQASPMACTDRHGHLFLSLSRLQGLLLMHQISLMLFLLTGFADWASGQSGGEIARTKLMSYLYFPFISNKR